MAQPRILIIENETARSPGTEIRAMLQRRDCYRVETIDGPRADGHGFGNLHPDLIIPILPACTVTADRLLASLRNGGGHPPLLPVLRAADLEGMLEALIRWTLDFPVMPLKPAEVLARVHRLLGSRAQERTPRNPAPTDALGRAQLVGEDPALLK